MDNMLKDKNDDVQDTLKVLLQDSDVILFLISNGPVVAEEIAIEKKEDSLASTILGKEAEMSAKDIASPVRKSEEKKEGDTSKSPEQSSRR